MSGRETTLRWVPLVVLLLLGACGSDEPTPEAYFDALAAETQTYRTAVDDHRSAYGDELSAELAALADRADFSDVAAVDDYFDQAKEIAIVKTAELFTDMGSELRSLLDAIEELEPPENLAEEHQDAVASGEALAASMPITIEAVRSLDTIEDLNETIEAAPFTVAAQRFSLACQNLEAAAVAEGIEVELDCPDGVAEVSE
jgi:hypothetical protein